MKHVLVTILFAITFFAAMAYGIDREMARRDYVSMFDISSSNGEIKGCWFQSNCDHYNELLEKTEYNK